MDVPTQTTLALGNAMARTWFYGIHHPDYPKVGLEIRDLDYSADDWLMADPQRWYGSETGDQWLDFELSQIVLTISLPQ